MNNPLYTELINKYLELYGVHVYREGKPNGVYCEHHHIIPREAGGTDEIGNLVWLPFDAHKEAHRLLIEMYPNIVTLVYAHNLLKGTTEEERKASARKGGSTKRKPYVRDRLVREWVNVFTGEKRTSTRKDLTEEFGLYSSNVTQVIKGLHGHCKGWKLV
jgi:hypothetical protein